MSMKKLITTRMAQLAIPRGGGVSDGLKFLLDPNRVKDTARESQEWAKAAVEAVRNAVDPNPWKQSTDDEIATEILRKLNIRIQEKEKS